jgi:hypothetical protein
MKINDLEIDNIGKRTYMASSNILIYKFILQSNLLIKDIINKLEQQLLNETKFVIDDYNESEITGTYIYSCIYKSFEYDFETNSFQNITRKKYITTEFHIKLETEFMDIWGSYQSVNKIITAISLALDNRVIIEPLELNFSKIVEYLKKSDCVVVGKTTATQVAFNDGILADCTFDLSKYASPFEIIEKYNKNIEKISIKWKFKDLVVGMVIYTSGSIRIYRSRHSINNKQLHEIYCMLEYAGRRK